MKSNSWLLAPIRRFLFYKFIDSVQVILYYGDHPQKLYQLKKLDRRKKLIRKIYIRQGFLAATSAIFDNHGQ